MRFYTLPPQTVEWPYLLVNMRKWKELWKRSFEHAILDSGVEIFKYNPDFKDYPKSLLFRYSQKVNNPVFRNVFGIDGLPKPPKPAPAKIPRRWRD